MNRVKSYARPEWANSSLLTILLQLNVRFEFPLVPLS